MSEIVEKSSIVDKKDDKNIKIINDDDDSSRLRCRFYENQYPEVEEVVMANVTEIGEMGAYVTLLEYNNIEVLLIIIEL